MYVGIAGALLVFAGLWRATECLMSGRSESAMRLVPVGVIYFLLGCMIVGLIGGTSVQWGAVFVTATGMVGTFLSQGKSDVATWVSWTLVVFDAMILTCLVLALSA